MASSALPLPLSTPSPTTQTTTATAPDHLSSPILPLAKLKTPTIRSRLSKLCQEGQPHLARQLFDTLPRPSCVLWNTIIIGFICNNMPNEALLFYSQMKSASPGTKADPYTYSSTLKACADTRNFKMGKALHCHVLRCLPNPSRIVCNSLLNMYSACYNDFDYSQYDLVRRVFDTMRKRNVVAWNTLVSWYVKTERYAEAVKQFRMMMGMRITPSAVSFVNVFPALSAMGDYKNANVLHSMLLRLGGEYVTDLFVVSSAIFMYAELGCLEYARKIFDHCSERNTEIWNTMIGAYVQNNHPIEAIDLFFQAVNSELAILDEVTFLSVLTACSQMQQLELAGQLHAFIIKHLRLMPVILLNATIVMYSRCNSVDMSFKIFHKMPERDVVSWNTMISAFVQNGLDDEALMLVYEMQKQRFMIDSVTVTALLSASSNLRNPDIGKQTHAYLIRHDIQFEGMDSYLIDMYAKSGSVRIAERVFKKDYSRDRDQATWNSMIAGYTQNGLSEEAFFVFRQMLEQNLIPNAVTLASVLPACNPVGNIDMGKQLHGFSIRHYLDQNVFVGSALIDMYSKCGAVTNADNVFAGSHEKNSVTYTTMILGYGQHGMGERALSLFHSMQKSGIAPDAITFVAVLSACSYAGLVNEGLSIYDSMKREYNIKPLSAHYCCIADMLGRVGRVVEAYEFVKGLGKEGDVMEIWGSLLGACRIHKHFELGKIVAGKLLELEAANGKTGYHVLLSNMYAEEGKWENVDNVRKQMREKGLRKETGCSWIDTSGFLNCFASRDQNHPQGDEIYDILEELTVKMKDTGYRPSLNSSLDAILEPYD
ncbi:pentatricopeptide repeat-containing protein At3g22150, chloroplastic [Pyrus x bretschneideri]|uniref:pentatricopeptide repeat-containing protein At3g22150, chloroplastic n=1 Tax=Pyrus x bretschneideri TaxID=225117 RepID=UPI002030D291|nr:pentatricopeptide repeat-containing protein At3g22150, chloroplastic [Pyrus x bretschneideri]XP_018501757.2 pentatricopeptide repeat-containing protein At3g22150, chloroplastic [Pyrus x bretschneideri]XP_048434317.1 pentatricopeptide repeat-containing protein At3g22150, chloroplastic [Pyrus x bretschneideri]